MLLKCSQQTIKQLPRQQHKIYDKQSFPAVRTYGKAQKLRSELGAAAAPAAAATQFSIIQLGKGKKNKNPIKNPHNMSNVICSTITI